jgi:DNA-binding NarL/FixJ family response regulator
LSPALLTRREREIAGLVNKGLKNKEVGQRLFISETTVRHHLTTIFNKLEVRSRFELIDHLHRHKLIPQERTLLSNTPEKETRRLKG